MQEMRAEMATMRAERGNGMIGQSAQSVNVEQFILTTGKKVIQGGKEMGREG